MSLTYGFKNARDLFEKLKRDAKKLEEEVNSDNVFNFIVTAYHIKDWIKNDPSNSQDIRNQAKELPKNEKIIDICQDIANASKHFDLNRDGQRHQKTSNVSSEQGGFGDARFGKGNFGKGEEEIIIKLLTTSDNSQPEEFNILDFKTKVVEFWQNFLDNNRL